MGTAKRERKKAGHRARIEVERRLDRRDRRRRLVLTTVASIVAVVAVAGLFVALSEPGSSTGSAATTSSSSTTSSTLFAPLASAAGKPCIDVTDPLPAGAPPVIMPVGEVPTSLVVQDLVTGTGDPIAAGAAVTVNYIGIACSTGQVFDSSWTRGKPETFGLDQVITGWGQGLVGMRPNGRRELIIPASLAYGSEQQGSKIAPDETLVFVVDLISSTPSSATTTVAPN